jgi:hypothetical protein
MKLHPQFLVDERGDRKGVLLSVEEYEKLLDTVEDRLDAADLDAVVEDQEFVPYEQVREQLRCEGKL